MGGIPPGLLSRAGLLKLIVMLSSSSHWVSPLSCLCQALGPVMDLLCVVNFYHDQAPGPSHSISVSNKQYPIHFHKLLIWIQKSIFFSPSGCWRLKMIVISALCPRSFVTVCVTSGPWLVHAHSPVWWHSPPIGRELGDNRVDKYSRLSLDGRPLTMDSF